MKAITKIEVIIIDSAARGFDLVNLFVRLVVNFLQLYVLYFLWNYNTSCTCIILLLLLLY